MPSKSTAPGRLMTTKEVAERIRTSVDALYMMRRRGTAPRGFRRGHSILWPEADVERWLAEQLAADPLAQRASA